MDEDQLDATIGLISIVAIRLIVVIVLFRFTKDEWPWHGNMVVDVDKTSKQEFAIKYLIQAGQVIVATHLW